MILGGVDFTSTYLVLPGDVPDGVGLATARDAGAAILAYGAFVTAIINFLVISFVVFMLAKAVNRIRKAAERPDDVAPEIETRPSELDVLIEIRDALKRD